MISRFGVGALVVFACACDDDPQSHVYEASPYVAAMDCFGPSTPLAQIETADGDLDCAPTCLLTTAADGTTQVYVSSMCGPYPAGFDATQTSPLCPAALAAWPAEVAALADGTNSCVEEAEDAGEGDGAGATSNVARARDE